jgi:hypothetical protein
MSILGYVSNPLVYSILMHVQNEAAIPLLVTVHEEHHCQVLILGLVAHLSSFSFCWDIRVCHNLLDDSFHSIGLSAVVAP